MDILQLCCFTNLWPKGCCVESWDLKNNLNVFDISPDYAKKFDLVVASPPCDQFTRANSRNWVAFPDTYIELALKCFELCRAAPLWVLENPPGRIEKFIPALKYFRIATWHGSITNKEYIIYSNSILLLRRAVRYGKENIPSSKVAREAWQQDFIDDLCQLLNVY